MQKEQKHKQGLLQNLIKIQDDIDLIQYTITSLLDDGIIADNKDMVDEMIQISSSLEKEIDQMVYTLYGSALMFLILLGALSAKTGGSSMSKAVIRITFWGTVAMGLTALVGYLFGVNLS